VIGRALRTLWRLLWWIPEECTRQGVTLGGHRVRPPE
jgi:hypothetical protein